MDKEYLEKVVNEDVMEDMEEFLEAETAFFMYVEYEGGEKGVKTVISPAPDMDTIEEVMRKVAEKIYEEAKDLPRIIIGCEKVGFRRVEDTIEFDQDGMEEGMIIVAMDAMDAGGFATLYSMPDMKVITSRDFDSETEDMPPYTMTAIASFMHETLQQAELVEEDSKKSDKVDVQFKFSRN